MILTAIQNRLWGEKGRFRYLLFASFILLFGFLGAREIWTQEHRWADIVSGMFYHHDFLHPFLGAGNYYDKPLLSYWLMAFFSYLFGDISTLALRLPSAFAGLLAVYSIFKLGKHTKNKSLGLLSGWMLLTTFSFAFWARVANTEMLNMAGALFAVAWYMDHKNEIKFKNYFVFFVILALTSLCKGLVGAVVAMLAVLTDMMLQRSFFRHMNRQVFFALIPALFIYSIPFIASMIFSNPNYHQNGLYMVYRENILRYIHPFDHVDPVYTYFIYLPLFVFPWVFFFIPALFSYPKYWRDSSTQSRWVFLTMAVLFLFFTASGSRRYYYILPVVPFAILFTADWLLNASKRCLSIATLMCCLTYVLLFTYLDLFPVWFQQPYGIEAFSNQLLNQVKNKRNDTEWKIVLLDVQSKFVFYLKLPPDVKQYGVVGDREIQTSETLLKTWLFLKAPPKDTIFVTRKRYQSLLAPYFLDYSVFEISKPSDTWFKHDDQDDPIAFVPKKSL